MKVDGINANATIVVAIRLADDGRCDPWLENAHEEGKSARPLPLQSKLHDMLARNDIQIQVAPHFARFFVTTLLAPLYGVHCQPKLNLLPCNNSALYMSSAYCMHENSNGCVWLAERAASCRVAVDLIHSAPSHTRCNHLQNTPLPQHLCKCTLH